jgi:hypothetical protein
MVTARAVLFLFNVIETKLSTLKFDVGVFTQPGSKGEMLAASRCFPLFTQQRTSLYTVGMSQTCRQKQNLRILRLDPPAPTMGTLAKIFLRKLPRTHHQRIWR